MFVPVTDPSLVAHWPLAVAAVDVQSGGGLVEAGDGAAGTQLDDLVGNVPQFEPLQQVYVGHVPVLLWGQRGPKTVQSLNKTPIIAAAASPDLSEVIDLLANLLPQHDEHGHGHLHVAALGVVAQHLAHDGAEEVGV